jgi:hypothetical protein
LKLEIESRKSSIFQTFKGNIQNRTKIVRAVVRVSTKSANILIEVANLVGRKNQGNIYIKVQYKIILWSKLIVHLYENFLS